MKKMLIKVQDAAEKLGVTRQTVLNWMKKGVIKPVHIGNATYINAEFLKELQYDLKEVNEAREKLKQIKEEITLLSKKESLALNDLRVEMKIIPHCLSGAVRREFYLSVLDMLEGESGYPAREKEVLRLILEGSSIGEISEMLHLTRERIRQIAYKAVRRAGGLVNLNALKEENVLLKRDIEVMTSQLSALGRHVEELRLQLGLANGDGEAETTAMYNLLTTPLKKLELSVRCLNSMHAIGVKTLGDLVSKSREEVFDARNVGRRTINEIDELLQINGLDFGFNVDAVYSAYCLNKSGKKE